jgi:hypothetical protein
MNWIILSGNSASDVEASFSAMNARLGAALGIPSADGHTTQYAQPLEHPTLNQIAIPITDEAVPFLTDAERAALYTTEYLRTAGFFPTIAGPPDPTFWQQFKGWLGF